MLGVVFWYNSAQNRKFRSLLVWIHSLYLSTPPSSLSYVKLLLFADGRDHSGSLMNSQVVIRSEMQTEYLPGASGVIFWWRRLTICGYSMQVVAWCETKSCKNVSVGFCSGLNWSKKVKFHYVSVLVSARLWVKIRWISSQDLSFAAEELDFHYC